MISYDQHQAFKDETDIRGKQGAFLACKKITLACFWNMVGLFDGSMVAKCNFQFLAGPTSQDNSAALSVGW